jgi:glycine cleavage system H protein
VAERERLIFEMGLYKATFPVDLTYSESHFWFQTIDNKTRCGLSAYAGRLLQDLFRIDWKVYVGEAIACEQVLGEVESTKASSELYAPMSGKLLDINSAAVNDPSLLTVDPYDAWLLEFEGKPERALDSKAYVEFLAAGWEETLKMLKGQV